jgi:hypothetical protein
MRQDISGVCVIIVSVIHVLVAWQDIAVVVNI